MASLLVLWDVDYTLADTGAAGNQLYRTAFAELFGGQPPPLPPMSGRTDRAIVLELLTRAGVPDPGGQVSAFQAVLAARAPQVAGMIRSHGRALPGAAGAISALAALAAADGAAPAAWSARSARAGASAWSGRAGATAGRDGDRACLVQSLLTGNIPALAEVKLGALGLTRHLDLAVGAYGDASEVRADLVHLARQRAAQAYRCDFGGTATVLVGDTPLDVEAALLTGARAVAVATGKYGQDELAAAGAHAVLPDLTNTGQVLSAILGQPAVP